MHDTSFFFQSYLAKIGSYFEDNIFKIYFPKQGTTLMIVPSILAVPVSSTRSAPSPGKVSFAGVVPWEIL